MTDVTISQGAAGMEETAFYAVPGVMTDLTRFPSELFEDLPDDPVGLARVVQGLLVHEEWAAAYGLDLPDDRRQEVRTRPAWAMVEAVLALDPRPLVEARPPERRMVGNCRHFATLGTALLRRAAMPARARCGFAGYFEPGKMVDHWITEYRKADRWVRIDMQVDELQGQLTGISFDPRDLPADAFLPAGEAWARCRAHQDDPARYGIFDMWGLWFILSNVVRDLAALNKVELLPWDSWGPMTYLVDPDPDRAARIDAVTGTIASGDLVEIRRLYQDEEGLAVPATVFDGRFQEQYEVPSASRPQRVGFRPAAWRAAPEGQGQGDGVDLLSARWGGRELGQEC